MALEEKRTSDLIRIAAAGGGFRLDAALRSTEDLIRIAAAARGSGATIYLCGLDTRPTADLIRIGAAGKGAVVFED